MEPVEIADGDLLLRPWRATDADAVYRACQDPDIQRWTTIPVPYLPEHAAGFVTDASAAAWASGSGAPFAVCDASTGELLAACGLVSIDRTLGSAEVGYWTAPWARGRGVAARATRALARWAFDELKVRRIVWQAEVGNHASRLVALRAGFRLEGQLRLASPHTRGRPDGWIGSLLPGDLAGAPAVSGARHEPRPLPGGRGSLDARRSAVFGRPQPVLFATAGATEIRLRRPEWRDVDAIAASCRDPETVRWTGVPDPYHSEDAQFFAGTYADGQWARGDGAVFVIADEADAYAGAMELRLSPADPAVADVAFMVAPVARGRGYCPAALAALCAWGFTALGLARIEWRAYVGNDASRRAAEKAGFRFEGTARQSLGHRGKRMDAWVAALLAEDAAR